jgi:ATP-dependent DNA helicase DinG
MISTLENAPLAGLISEVEQIFSRTGVLSRGSTFEYRPQQQQMAMAVARALQNKEHLLVEAGTGVGKSFGYLVPSILFAVANRKKAVISTHTINLQEQLFGKDLPILEKILPVRFSYTLLKGRGNYLCTRRLHKTLLHAETLFSSPEVAELQRILEWSRETKDGSLSDFQIEPDPKVWAQVCSERGLCSPKLCGEGSEFAQTHGMPCFFQRARARILSSDLLVVNHTLFFTLLGGIEEEVKGGVMFKNDFVVFDEAHTVEQVASRHIGVSISSAQVRYALQRLWNPKTGKGLLALVSKGKAVQLVASALEEAHHFFEVVETACNELSEKPAKPAIARNRNWSELRIRRPELVKDTITLPIQRLRESISEMIKLSEDTDTGQELMECNRRLTELREGVAEFLNHANDDHVYWVERSGKAQQNLTLNAAPIDVAAYLRQRLFGADTSVIMTSATLSIQEQSAPGPMSGRGNPENSGLNYLGRRVGAEEAVKLQVGSPFEYERQMKFYVVNKMPDPRENGYSDALVQWISHFIRQTHGKAFVLFTNSRLMHEAAERLAPFFNELGLDCYVQGKGTPRTVMLEKFKDNVDSVLFGTDSFWQGVDVPGEALSNVIITRLPFAVPDHPLIEARVEKIEAEGGDSFREFSLPEAVLKFRQGVGRLIRTKSDSGIVVVLDNRILTKKYGQIFLNSIPKCPVEIV